MPESYDVILIGGGIMGCSCAFTLARRGLKVALFEQGSIGEGPTGQSSGILRTHYSNELTTRMAKFGLEVYSDFERQVGDECGFHQTGFLMLLPVSERAKVEATLCRHRELGIRTELLEHDALKTLMPGLTLEPDVCGVWEPDSGYADAYLAVGAYKRAAERFGADIFQEVAVENLGRLAGCGLWVETQRGRFEAPHVVNTAGAWGARVASMVGVELPITPCRVQVAFFQRPEAEKAIHPIVADFSHATYFRSEGEDLTLVGLIDPGESAAVVDPDSYQKKVDFGFQASVGARLVDRYPGMEDSDSTGGYASLYAVTPDWHPIISEIPSGSGFLVCSGFSGHGFKLAPAVGVIVADMVTAAEDPTFDPNLFRADRFDSGDGIQGNYEFSIVG